MHVEVFAAARLQQFEIYSVRQWIGRFPPSDLDVGRRFGIETEYRIASRRHDEQGVGGWQVLRCRILKDYEVSLCGLIGLIAFLRLSKQVYPGQRVQTCRISGRGRNEQDLD